MKSKFVLIFFVTCAATFSMAAGKTVATCGNYTLNQDVHATNFAGILHQVNNYELIDQTGERLRADIEANSEGAVLKAAKAIKINQQTGAVLESEELEIVAMWGEFHLTVSRTDGQKVKINCAKK